MKCIQCGTDNNLQDRTGNQGRCKNCNHSFVFEPTTMPTFKLTDPLFAKAIADISANSTLFFTAKQFFYLLDKRLGKTFNSLNAVGRGCLLLFLIIIGGLISCWILSRII